MTSKRNKHTQKKERKAVAAAPEAVQSQQQQQSSEKSSTVPTSTSVPSPQKEGESRSLSASAKPKRRHRCCKWIVGILFFFLLLILGALFFVVGTTSGARWTLKTVQPYLPPSIVVDTTIEDGSVVTGLKLGKTHFALDKIIDITADDLILQYRLTQLYKMLFDVQKLESHNLKVTLADEIFMPSNKPKEPKKESTEPFRLPFPLDIRIADFAVRDFDLYSPIVDVSVGSLTAQLGAHQDNVYLHHTMLDTATVHLKSTQEQEGLEVTPEVQPQIFASLIDTLALEIDGNVQQFDSFAEFAEAAMTAASEGKKFALVTLHKEVPTDVDVAPDASPEEITAAFQEALDKAQFVKTDVQKGVRVFGPGEGEIRPLPEIILPFDISVDDFNAHAVRYYMDGFDTDTADIKIEAAWVDQTIVIPEISLRHKIGELQARGQVVMDKFLAMDIELKGEAYTTEENKTLLEGLPYGLKGVFNVTGDLTNLIAHATLNLGGFSNLSLQANVLSPALPMRVSLQTREFAWPIFAEPLVNLQRIDLKAEGNIADGLAIEYASAIEGFGFTKMETEFTGQVSIERAHIEDAHVKGFYKGKALEARVQGDAFYGAIFGADARVRANINDAAFLLPQLKGPLHLDADVMTLINNAVKAPSAISLVTKPSYIKERIPRTEASSEDFDDLRDTAKEATSKQEAKEELADALDLHISDLSSQHLQEQGENGTAFRVTDAKGAQYDNKGNISYLTEDDRPSSKKERLSSDLSEQEYLDELEEVEGSDLLQSVELPEVRFDIRQIRGDLVFNGVKTALDAVDIKGDLQKGMTVGQFRLTQPNNSILMEGDIVEDKADLRTVVNITKLHELVPSLRGKIQAQVSCEGSLKDLTIDFSGNAPYLGIGTVSLHQLVFDSAINTQTRGFNFTVLSNSLRVGKAMKPFRQCFMDFSGSPMRHNFTFNCGGTSTVYMSLDGGFSEHYQNYAAHILEIYLSTEASGALSLANPVDFAIDFETGIGEVSPIELRGEIGKLSTTTLSFSPGNIATDVSLRHFNAKSLSEFYPDSLYIDAPIDIDASVNIVASIPDIAVDIFSNKGYVISTTGAALGYDSFALHSEISDRLLHNTFVMTLSRGDGTIDSVLDILHPMKEGALSGYFKVNDFDLETLSNVGQSFTELKGLMQVDTTFAGELKNPQIMGDISLIGMAIPRYDVGQINKFNLQLKAQGTTGLLNGYIKLNGENLNLDGTLDWSQSASGFIHAQAKRLPIFLIGYGTALADIDTGVTLGDILDIKGKLHIPVADIAIRDMGASGATVSEDEIIVPESGTQSLMHKQESLLKTAIDVKMSLGKDVRVAALGMVKGNLIGDLHVTQKPNGPIKGFGDISMEYGKVDVYGKKFVIDTAEVLFRDDITQPNLNVLVLADKDYLEDDDVEVGIKVTGVATNPEIKLFSKPSMSQNEMLSYIFYGHGLEKESMLQSGNNDALLMGLGFSGVSGLVNSITSAFGMQNLQLATQGYGDETQVAIQGYLSKNIRLSYGYGVFNAVGEFKLRYELMHQLYLEFISSIDQAVDIIYSFEID